MTSPYLCNLEQILQFINSYLSWQEQLEKKKAAYKEKLKNKLAALHKSTEEKRAMAEAKRGEEMVLAEEMAAKYRAKSEAPTKLFGLLKA